MKDLETVTKPTPYSSRPDRVSELYNMDCLEGMKRIPDKSVDMILCDLPYGTTACKWDIIIPFEMLWLQYERIIKDNGAIVLTASQPFTSALVMSNVKLFRHSWVWDKKTSSNFMNAKHQPLKVTEDILVFSKSKAFYNPQLIDKEKTHGIGNIYNNNSRLYQMKEKFTRGSTRSIPIDKGYPKNIITFSQGSNFSNNKLHPTQKPVALFEYLIKTYTNEGETVLDNCMGSGTTAIACINTGRNYIGFEKEGKYYKVIQDRIKNHVVQQSLFLNNLSCQKQRKY